MLLVENVDDNKIIIKINDNENINETLNITISVKKMNDVFFDKFKLLEDYNPENDNIIINYENNMSVKNIYNNDKYSCILFSHENTVVEKIVNPLLTSLTSVITYNRNKVNGKTSIKEEKKSRFFKEYELQSLP